MVSKACDSQLSSSWSAALIPPCAALECERTGWTLLMMPTETPCSAAASAARCPARPAPITSTSCVGKTRARLWEPVSRPLSGRSERAADLIGRDNPAQDTLGVNGHDCPQLCQTLCLEQRLERRVGCDLEAAGVRDHHLVGRVLVADAFRNLVDLALGEDAEHVAGLIDDREPRVAVAQEELLVGLVELGPRVDRDWLRVHDVGHAQTFEARVQGALRFGRPRCTVDEPGDREQPQPE